MLTIPPFTYILPSLSLSLSFFIPSFSATLIPVPWLVAGPEGHVGTAPSALLLTVSEALPEHESSQQACSQIPIGER